MYRNYKIVAVTPAGRRPYLEILSKYISRDTHIVDEWHLWLNTVNPDDIAYCNQLEKSYSFVKTKALEGRWFGNRSIHHFFKGCLDTNTIYVRFDDDIVWIEPEAIKNLLDFRIDNPEYFLVFPNIINNSLMNHIHQRMGIFPTTLGLCDYAVLDKNGWKRGDVAKIIHEEFLKNVVDGTLDKYRFNRWMLFHYERFSINSFAFFGKDFFQFGGAVDPDEENWLSKHKSAQLGRMNCVCGTSIVAHFAYHTQRPFLEGTNILQKYKKLSRGRSIKEDEPENIPIEVCGIERKPIKSDAKKSEPEPILISIRPDKMDYKLSARSDVKVVSIAPHKQEHTINLDLFKLNIWCHKNNYAVHSHGNVNQFPLLSMISDTVTLSGGTPDIYGSRPNRYKLPAMRNYQEVDVTGSTPLTDWMRVVKAEVTNEEVIEAFAKPKICVRKSTFDLYESLKDDLPKDCIWCEAKFDHAAQFDNSESIRRIKEHDFGMPVYGLEESMSFQRSILDKVRHHYMGIQVLCSLLSNVYFLCLRGSSNLFSVLPAKCICYADAYLEHTITAYLDERHEQCVKQFPPNKELLKELLSARYGDMASLACVEPWEHPDVGDLLGCSEDIISEMAKLKAEIIYEL